MANGSTTMKYQRILTALGAIVSVLIIGGLVTILITAVLSYKNTNNEENSVAFNVSSLVSAWVGDGKCDDVTNTNIFDFDGGDCYLENTIQGNCIACICDKTGESLIQTTTELASTTVANTTTTHLHTVTVTSTFTSTTNWPGPCPNNWTLINDLCYLISNQSGSLMDAQFFCAIHDGIVLEPRSEMDDLAVQSYLDENKKYWLGFNGFTSAFSYKIEYLSTGLEVIGYFGNGDYATWVPSDCGWTSSNWTGNDSFCFFVLNEENQWKWSCECTGYQEQKEAYITCQAEKRLDIVK